MISAQMATHNFGTSMSLVLLRYGVVKQLVEMLLAQTLKTIGKTIRLLHI
jgi:hypothetical protein